MFVLVVFLNTLCSYFIASYIASTLAIFIAFFGLIVLNMEILSLFSAINEYSIVFLTAIEAVIALIFQKKKKFPLLYFDNSFKENLKKLKNALLLDKSLIILSFAFIILITVTFFLSVVMPALEPDSQTYHFYRAVEFASQKNLLHIETNDIRGIIMPINSEIIYTWMFLFKKNFYGCGILSFFSFLTVISAISSILLRFKFSIRQSLWTIFVFSSLSAVILQISSLQTDITVGALLISSLALFFDSDNKRIFFSSLALALAAGTKSTGLIAIPGFFILISGISYFIKNEKNLKSFLIFLKFFILNFIVFSSYNYILNFIHFGNPFSNYAAYLGHKFWGGFQGFIGNIVRFFFQAFDFTGFKWGYYLNDKILALKLAFFNLIQINPLIGCNVEMEKVNIIADEQVTGFGILGFSIFLPSVFVCIFQIFKNFKNPKNKKRILLALLALCFLINIAVLSLSVAYMVFSIRFIVAFVALSTICAVVSYRKKSFLKPIFIFFMLFYMILIPTHNKRMPFWVVLDNLKKNNFSLKTFQQDCYRGKVTDVLKLAPMIYDTILKRYENAKKIAIFKTTDSPLLYLKTLENKGYTVDFLLSSSMEKYDLKSYDLIILEDQMQDDNVFNPKDVKITYKIQDGNVIFDDYDGVKCFYIGESKNPQNAISRKCIGYDFIKRNPDFIEDFKEQFEEKFELSAKSIFVNIYYFKNREFSDRI